MLKSILIRALRRLPLTVFQFVKPIINKISWIDMDALNISRRIIFVENMKANFEKEMKKILRQKRCMIISEGEYSYSYFNAYYLNNMMALILYSLSEGYVPIIKVNDDKPQYNKWDWYFKQPVDSAFGGVDISDFKTILCDKKHFFQPCFPDAFDLEGENFQFWNFMYHHFAILKDDIKTYIQNEIDTFGNTEKRLGVLIRGTDYVTLKPKGHPIQPSIEDLLEEVNHKMKTGGYQYLYVATEEERLFNMVCDRFGADKVLSNKRTYYDKNYYQNDCKYIGEVHFDRENDNYLKGLEYLSSLVILSKCDGFIGGNCGGTLSAMLFSENQDYATVINRGYYS